MTSPTNGDIFSFICDTSVAQIEWVNIITRAMTEWLSSFKGRTAEEIQSTGQITTCSIKMFSIAHTVPVFSAKVK